jgi:hypothetical protein
LSVKLFKGVGNSPLIGSPNDASGDIQRAEKLRFTIVAKWFSDLTVASFVPHISGRGPHF